MNIPEFGGSVRTTSFAMKKRKRKKKNRKSQENAISVPFRFVLSSKITDGTVDLSLPLAVRVGCVCVVCCLLCVCCVLFAVCVLCCSVLCALCCQLCLVCVGPGDI